MGCDIHMRVEKRVDGRWVPASPNYRRPDCDGSGEQPKWDASVNKYSETEKTKCSFCSGGGKVRSFTIRSYDTFAILANVRNGTGFAGVVTGQGFNYISEPRGLPPDLSPDHQEQERYWDENEDGTIDKGYWFGDHSHSWLTLRELLDFDWQQRTVKQGVVSAAEFKEWDAKGGGWPKSWSGGVSGGQVRHFSNAELRDLIRLGRDQPHDYTSVQWGDTYARCAREFYDNFIPALKALGEPDDVRIVFGFDS